MSHGSLNVSASELSERKPSLSKADVNMCGHFCDGITDPLEPSLLSMTNNSVGQTKSTRKIQQQNKSQNEQ